MSAPRTYRGETITRVRHNGFYTAHVLAPDGFYRPLMADTLAGIRSLIRHTLDGVS